MYACTIHLYSKDQQISKNYDKILTYCKQFKEFLEIGNWKTGSQIHRGHLHETLDQDMVIGIEFKEKRET